MSTRTIVITFHDATSALVDEDSVVIGSTGVRRVDTNGIVVAPGTSVPRVSLGNYQLAFTEPAPGLAYTGSFVYSMGGVAQPQQAFNLAPVILTAGPWAPYGTIDDIRLECGNFNADAFADPSGTSTGGTLSTEQIQHYQQAGDTAVAEIESRITAQGFSVPPTPSIGSVKIAWRKFAAYELYQIRGLDNSTKDDGSYSNAFTAKRKEAMKIIRRLLIQSLVNPGASGSFTRATGQSFTTPQGVDVNSLTNLTDTVYAVVPYGYGYSYPWGY